jgi:hypothetical protein
MKRLWTVALLLAGLALASTPAYPENSVGLGYAHPAAGVFTLGALLPAAPLGLDTGVELEVRYPRLGVSATGKILVLPSLTVGGQFMAVGAFAELRYADPGAFGGYLGGGFSWDLPPLGPVEGALSGQLGVGYFPKGGLLPSLVSYGLGLRLYHDPVALELVTNDRDLFRGSLLFLW